MKSKPHGSMRPAVRALPVNRQIRAREVRVIGEEGEQMGTLPIAKALQVAQERELDLVMVAPNSVPPVCRLVDYGKFRYEQLKKEKHGRKSQKGLLREVRLRPKIEEHDLQDKIRKTRELLAEGNKVKITVRFRGREIVYPELGWQVLKRVAEAFGSTCHGAGRLLSRSAARKSMRGDEVEADLRRRHIHVRTGDVPALAEEASPAYKDVADVVDVVQGAGICRKVARAEPLGVIKG